MPRRRKRSPRTREGLSLVEVAIGLSIVGVFLAVFVPTFVREVRRSKISEASEQIAEIHRLASAYYDTTHTVAGRGRRACLPPAAGPAPAEPSEDPVEVDMTSDETPGHETWVALGYAPPPIRYRYTFLPERVGCGLTGSDVLTVRAEGDLDGDGNLSLFERRATVRDHVLVPREMLYVQDRIE